MSIVIADGLVAHRPGPLESVGGPRLTRGETLEYGTEHRDFSYRPVLIVRKRLGIPQGSNEVRAAYGNL